MNAVAAESARLDRRFGLAGIAEFHLDLADPDAAEMVVDSILSHATRTTDHLFWEQPRPAFMADAGAPGALTGLLHGAAGQGLLLLRLDACIRGRAWLTRFPDSPYSCSP